MSSDFSYICHYPPNHMCNRNNKANKLGNPFCCGLTPASSQAPGSHSLTAPPAGLGRESKGKSWKTHGFNRERKGPLRCKAGRCGHPLSRLLLKAPSPPSPLLPGLPVELFFSLCISQQLKGRCINPFRGWGREENGKGAAGRCW